MALPVNKKSYFLPLHLNGCSLVFCAAFLLVLLVLTTYTEKKMLQFALEKHELKLKK